MSGIDLYSERIGARRGDRVVLFLHGILGSGQNLRAIARRLVEARPELTACLVDLRGHGHSPKHSPDPSVDACAEDVARLARDAHAVAAVGHSFGGKVALALAHKVVLGDVVMIDTMPGPREPLRDADSALAVLATVASLGPVFPNRAAFVRELSAKHGSRVAQWLALSTESTPEGIRFALDHAEIEALLLDYFALDQWPLVENPPGDTRVHLVIGERSTSYSRADRERANAVAGRQPRVTVATLPTDHWVHAEDPDGLLRVLTQQIRALPDVES